MIVALAAVPFTSLIVPLLASAAAWGIAVWALKQADPMTRVLAQLTQEGQSNRAAGSHTATGSMKQGD